LLIKAQPRGQPISTPDIFGGTEGDVTKEVLTLVDMGKFDQKFKRISDPVCGT